MIPRCPGCLAELGPWEDQLGCLTCRGLRSYTIADRAVSLLEAIARPLPYWDVARLLRADGGGVWEASLKAQLATDRRMCWAGRGTYGLFRHGLLPGVRDLARLGGVYLHAADRVFTLEELAFALTFVGYRFQELSLRNALWRGVELGIYRNESVQSWSGSKESVSRQREAARAMGLTRGPWFSEIIDRSSSQVDTALLELERRRNSG